MVVIEVPAGGPADGMRDREAPGTTAGWPPSEGPWRRVAGPGGAGVRVLAVADTLRRPEAGGGGAGAAPRGPGPVRGPGPRASLQ
ncbi:hypothetical protein SFR_4034 [Streptomyces sp. FR-008]|nr:hypothetical protein SFR_4034 [Streptomyces sp. FR-008]